MAWNFSLVKMVIFFYEHPKMLVHMGKNIENEKQVLGLCNQIACFLIEQW